MRVLHIAYYEGVHDPIPPSLCGIEGLIGRQHRVAWLWHDYWGTHNQPKEATMCHDCSLVLGVLTL